MFGLQMHIPIAGKGWRKIEMGFVEGGGGRNIADLKDGIVLGYLHGLFLKGTETYKVYEGIHKHTG